MAVLQSCHGTPRQECSKGRTWSCACEQGNAEADPAADAALPEPDAQPGPVFVPIVLAMDEADHAPLLEEWLARQPVTQVYGITLSNV